MGKRWPNNYKLKCSKCKKQALEECQAEPHPINVFSEQSSDDDSSTYEPEEEAVDDLNSTLDSLDCSPIKISVSKRDKVPYGKRKLQTGADCCKKKK